MDNGTDVPMSGDPISQSYDSLWHFNSTSADAGFQQGLPPSIGVGSHISNLNKCAFQKV